MGLFSFLNFRKIISIGAAVIFLGGIVLALTYLKLSAIDKRLAAFEENLSGDSFSPESSFQNLESNSKADKESLGADLPRIVSEWRPRIVYLVCEWGEDGEIKKIGSGVAFVEGKQVLLHTNNHVIWEEGFGEADSCTATFPDEKKKFDAVLVPVPSNGPDLGILRLEVSASIFDNLKNNKVRELCPQKAEIGDRMIVMGYPLIGSTEDITVTEGIISGFEEDYFVISAKVDEGNSGGAAILVKDDCYLGIPTFVKRGELESLARILDGKAIARWISALENR